MSPNSLPALSTFNSHPSLSFPWVGTRSRDPDYLGTTQPQPPSSTGQVLAFGVFQTYYASNQLQNSTASDISWIGGVQILLLYVSGSVLGRVFDLYGARVSCSFRQTFAEGETLISKLPFFFSLWDRMFRSVPLDENSGC